MVQALEDLMAKSEIRCETAIGTVRIVHIVHTPVVAVLVRRPCARWLARRNRAIPANLVKPLSGNVAEARSIRSAIRPNDFHSSGESWLTDLGKRRREAGQVRYC